MRYLTPDGFAVYHLYDNLYHGWSSNPFQAANKYLNVLISCRQLYAEAAELLYDQAYITVCVMGSRNPKRNPRGRSRGQPEVMRMWRFVKNLRLEIFVEKGSENKHVILERVKKFAGEVVNYGRHLRKLQIAFVTAEDQGLPRHFEDVVEALTVFNVSGEVEVFIADDEYEDVEAENACKVLEKVIRRSSIQD